MRPREPLPGEGESCPYPRRMAEHTLDSSFLIIYHDRDAGEAPLLSPCPKGYGGTEPLAVGGLSFLPLGSHSQGRRNLGGGFPFASPNPLLVFLMVKEKGYLIVDDPGALKGYLEEFQLTTGAQVFTARNREEGLLYLDPQKILLVILDFTRDFPDRSSLYFEIVSLPNFSTVPCLFLPDRGTVKHVEKLIHRPEDRIALKPITGAQLAQEVSAILKLPLRKPLELMVRIYLESGQTPFSLRAKTVNMSSNGMLVRLREELPLEGLVQILITLPGGAVLRLRGVVRRHQVIYNEHGYGIELLEVLEGDPRLFAQHYDLKLELLRRAAQS